MSYSNYVTDSDCKFEILAEILLHNKLLKKNTVTVLCSRLLAHYKTRKQDINFSQQIMSYEGNDCSSVQEQFTNLSISESDYSNWYEYWKKNGEDFVNETWVKQYGSCTLEDLPMDPEELYTKHREEQYRQLYWKFIKEMDCNSTINEEHTYDELYSEELEEIEHVKNFDFLYKYKHFTGVNSKLITTYKALSLIGLTYNNQNIFKSGFVQYCKKNIIKSTRHLNVYKFPKIKKLNNINSENETLLLNANLESENPNNCDCNKQCGSLCVENSLKINSDKNVKENETSKKEKKICKQLVRELERFGYSYLQNNPKLLKYWKKRHLLFSKFAKGIQLDEESWYSVTPEIISNHIAYRCSCYLIIDPFCGAGGNIIQFAKTCELVIAIDNDPKKIEIARHNAELYGVADRIQFIIGNYFDLAPTLKADVVFLSPPWGGPAIRNLEEYKLSYMMPKNGGGKNILSLARQITSNIALHLPKNSNIFDCIHLGDDGFVEDVEVQQNVLNSRYNSLTVYYGELYGLCDNDIS